MTDRLRALSRGFRQRFLDHAELSAQLAAWAAEWPHLVRLHTLGTTAEGRPITLLQLGPEPDRRRPAVWVNGNQHASELCGSSVALAIAEDVLALHLDAARDGVGLGAEVARVLREVTVYVLPRVSPDGAEAVLTTGRFVRSVPRDARTPTGQARWIAHDVDGDGLALLMRQEDPTGEFVGHPAAAGLLVPRELGDTGPFYRVFPEGTIEGYDGRHIPEPDFLCDNHPDLNRNFPWSWRPEPDQVGAGAYPASEPESRGIVEFVTQHPEIFAWLDLHTFGGVFIRPLGHAPDTKLDPFDAALFRQLEQWASEHTRYPMVSGYEEFTYEPDRPLHGDLSDYAYHQRGALAVVCELWGLFDELGLPRTKRFVDRYNRLTRNDALKVWVWDRKRNQARLFPPWRPWVHPQLGPLEVGGFDPRVGVWNPPQDRVSGICTGLSQWFLRVAAMAPRLVLGEPVVRPLGPGVFQVEVAVENHGYLPTFGLPSASRLPWNAPLAAELLGGEVEGPRRQEVGHLTGWGTGRFGEPSFYFPRSRGNQARAVVSWVLRGAEAVTVRVSGPRVGAVERSISLG